MTTIEIDAARKTAILANAPRNPKGTCHYCAYKVPPLALWCCSECATLYDREKAALLA